LRVNATEAGVCDLAIGADDWTRRLVALSTSLIDADHWAGW
jgi:hypothetical protein